MKRAQILKQMLNAETDTAPKQWVVVTENGKSDKVTYRQAKALLNYKLYIVGVKVWIEKA